MNKNSIARGDLENRQVSIDAVSLSRSQRGIPGGGAVNVRRTLQIFGRLLLLGLLLLWLSLSLA